MNTGTTHDTKRSEDTRARINVLSELPREWARALRRWSKLNPSDTAPDHNEQILVYQSMLGSWPIEADRMKQYVTKALREGKTHTNWIDVNEDYEARVLSFVDGLYGNETLLKDFMRFQKKIAYFGALSGLSQLVLRLTSPGIPDTYRGTEVWDLSLADPDNRRPVDFSSRVQMLEELKTRAHPKQLLKSWPDGRLKMFVAWKVLNLRRSQSALFLHGDYIPLRVTGTRADHVIAFARRLHDKWCIVAVPRLLAKLTRAGSPPLGETIWQDTAIELPPDAPREFTNLLTGEPIASSLRAADLFRILPFAVCV